jgi:hypothetical protein
MKVSNIK